MIKIKNIINQSTGCNCNFFKAKNGKWYLQLEDRQGSDEYSYYGPFSSQEQTHRYLNKHFANPGGYGTDQRGTRAVPTDLSRI